MDLSALASATTSPASILVARKSQEVYTQMAQQLLAGLPQPPRSDSASFSPEAMALLDTETAPSPGTPSAG